MTLKQQSCAHWVTTNAIALIVSMGCFTDFSVAQTIENVSPVTTDNPSSDSGSGGRINSLALDPNDNRTIYAASEWGGVFRSADRGDTWQHLGEHRPLATFDVAIDPRSSDTVFVSSLYDGRTHPTTGVRVSRNGGRTWSSGLEFPAGICAIGGRQDEVSGFGISINPDNPDNVIVGTNCGIAESTNGGESWTYIDPTPDTPGSFSYYDVVIHNGGIVDICGLEGVFRRPAPTPQVPNPVFGGGPTGGPFPFFGLCNIAVSPVNSDVMFVGTIEGVRESRDGGRTWPTVYPNPDGQGRYINIATNRRGQFEFDLWFGDIGLYSRPCINSSSGNTAPSCVSIDPGGGGLTGWTNVTGAAHADAGKIIFDRAASTNACPVAYANDGGVYINDRTESPECHTPEWKRPSVTPTALWVDGMSGINRTETGKETLVLGLQDNGQFITEEATDEADSINWTAPLTGDAPEVNATAKEPQKVVVTTLGVFRTPQDSAGNFIVPPFYRPPPGSPPGTPLVFDTSVATAQANCWDVPDPSLAIGTPPNVLTRFDYRNFGLQIQAANEFESGTFGVRPVPCQSHPPGQIRRFSPLDSYVRVPGAPGGYLIATSRGVYITPDISVANPTWREAGRNSPRDACDVKTASREGLATYFVRDRLACTPRAVGRILRSTSNSLFVPWLPTSVWGVVATDNEDVPPGTSAFGPYAVDPKDPKTIIALDHTYNPPRIVMTEDGGGTWARLQQLEELMTQGGTIKFVVNTSGPIPFNVNGGRYVQPSIFAFDPFDSRIVVAGGYNSGFFISTDKGRNWSALQNRTGTTPNISHPLHVHFRHQGNLVTIFIGTRGRGVWRYSRTRGNLGFTSNCVITDVDVDLPFDSGIPICRCLQDAGAREFRCGVLHPDFTIIRHLPLPLTRGKPYEEKWRITPLTKLDGPIELLVEGGGFMKPFKRVLTTEDAEKDTTISLNIPGLAPANPEHFAGKATIEYDMKNAPNRFMKKFSIDTTLTNEMINP